MTEMGSVVAYPTPISDGQHFCDIYLPVALSATSATGET